MKPYLLALGMSVAYAQALAANVAHPIIEQSPGYPCQSIDPGSCQEHEDPNALAPTFKSVSANTFMAYIVIGDTSTYPTTGKVPQ